ncbi:22183_t:CDS:1, partial [Dentiscutata erythropus]
MDAYKAILDIVKEEIRIKRIIENIEMNNTDETFKISHQYEKNK